VGKKEALAEQEKIRLASLKKAPVKEEKEKKYKRRK
jgi:hypothetical protein